MTNLHIYDPLSNEHDSLKNVRYPLANTSSYLYYINGTYSSGNICSLKLGVGLFKIEYNYTKLWFSIIQMSMLVEYELKRYEKYT